MQEQFAQIAVMSTLYLVNITSTGKGLPQACQLENIKPVKFDITSLFKGTWKTLKCTPYTYCNEMACAVNHFEQNDGKGILLHASNYNISSDKALTIEGKVKVTGVGRFEIETDYPNLRGVWSVIGTDYKNYWIIHGCIQGKSYFVINGREDKLKDSVKPKVESILKKSRLSLGLFYKAASPPNNKDCRNLVEKVGQEKEFQ